MNLSIYLAFTGAEASLYAEHSGKTAWMGCHLSSYTAGISVTLPPVPRCDMLILTDETPPSGHDPEQVASELTQTAKQLGCDRILLDFQRPDLSVSSQIVEAVLRSAPCAVGISEPYAANTDCIVFLSSPPLWTSPEEHIQPWKGREIWLEAITEEAFVSVTETDSRYVSCPQSGEFPFTDKQLCVSYRTELGDGEALFRLRRGIPELTALLHRAQTLGIHTAIGLHQQLDALTMV